MKEKDKRTYDALVSVRDHQWKEFEEKTRLEWRLNFGIWAALLTSTGAVIKANECSLSGSEEIRIAIAIVVFLVIILHYSFLHWIQGSLKLCRKFQHEAEGEMRKLLSLPPEIFSERKPAWKQPTVIVEMLISILLGTILLLAVFVSRSS